MQALWLKMKIQLSERFYLEDQTLIIQLTKKLLMQPLVSFQQPSDSTVLFFKFDQFAKVWSASISPLHIFSL